MRNANDLDIEAMQRTGVVPFDVMFQHVSFGLVHRKQLRDALHEDYALVETAEGSTCALVHLSNLGAIPKKQGTPPKPKKPHVKGVKRHLGYQKERIKDGVKVQTRNGMVLNVDATNSEFDLDTYRMNSFHIATGKNKLGYKGLDIVRILDSVDNSVSSKPSYCIGDVFGHGEGIIAILVSVDSSHAGLIGENGGRFCEPFFHEGVFTQIPASTVEAMLLDAWHDPVEWKYLGKFSDMFQKRN